VRTVRRIKSSILPSESSKEVMNARPDLIATEDDAADSTHPSEHNSVYVVNHDVSALRRRQREAKRKKALMERQRDLDNGRADPWTAIQLRRHQRSASVHRDAFFYPVPYWGLAPFGLYG